MSSQFAKLGRAMALRQALLQDAGGRYAVGGAVTGGRMRKRRMGAAGTKAGARKNPWLAHVQAYRQKHPAMSYKECLKNAAKSYKPKGASHKKAGGAVTGGRKKRAVPTKRR
jgi:hypothetical protein